MISEIFEIDNPLDAGKKAIKSGPSAGEALLAVTPSELRTRKTQIMKIIIQDKIRKQLSFSGRIP